MKASTCPCASSAARRVQGAYSFDQLRQSAVFRPDELSSLRSRRFRLLSLRRRRPDRVFREHLLRQLVFAADLAIPTQDRVVVRRDGPRTIQFLRGRPSSELSGPDKLLFIPTYNWRVVSARLLRQFPEDLVAFVLCLCRRRILFAPKFRRCHAPRPSSAT